MSNDSTLRKHLLSLKDYLWSLKEYFPGEGTKEGYSSTGRDPAGQEPTPGTSPETGKGLPPPLALREPVEHVIHGDRRIDHYAWLRKKDDPRVIAYLEEENAYVDGYLQGTEAFQEKLYQEMLGRIQQTDLSVPYSLRGYSYFAKTHEGKQYPEFCRRSEDLLSERPEEILLDLNAMSEGYSFLGLGSFVVSDDNGFLAYSADTTGFRQYALQVKNLATQAVLPFRVERVTSVAWSADGRSLFYTVEDETTKRSHRLYRHDFSDFADPPIAPETSAAMDTLLYEERDERFRVEVDRSRSGAYLFLLSASHTTSEVRFLRADRPWEAFQLMSEREDEHEYYVEHHPGASAEPWGGIFLIRTNTKGRTFRLMTTPVTEPAQEKWHEVIENRPGVMLGGLDAFRTHLVLLEREDGLPYLRVVDLTKQAPSALGASYRIAFAEPAYNAGLGNNPEFDSQMVRFTYESFLTPRSVYDYDVQTGERRLKKQQPVLGGYQPTEYGSERLHADAADGTQVPVSIVYKHGTVRDGSAPLLLYGYGSYGISMPVTFSSNRLSLLNRGFVFAIAHIRGGGELGKPWHDAGRMHKKMNTFTDFISTAEYLIAQGYTSNEKLVIEGGSAGGLLMGAVTNLRPDLFRVVVSQVPFVDVLNTILDPSLPLTVGEYEEWGNPQKSADYFYMKQYCPYTNVERKEYPSMLIKTGLNDSQVMYWEPAKYVAKLRAMKTDGNALLFKTNMGAGHGGASGRYDYLREIALDYAFVLGAMGIRE
jgi:oligopeptidase B